MTQRECQHPITRHQHGTNTTYTHDHCRCPACVKAHTRNRKLWAHRVHITQAAGLPVGLVDAAGTRRRLQALAAVGWSSTETAKLLDVSQQRAAKLRAEQRKVSVRTALRVRELYDALWDKPPTGPRVAYTRMHAARQGWPPPMAWDDDTIDDPSRRHHRRPQRGGAS